MMDEQPGRHRHRRRHEVVVRSDAVSHPEQLAFFEAVVATNPTFVHGSNVLEIGSYDVNGSMRRHFRDAADYTGVDLMPGPGVDVVAYGHEISAPDGHYDVALSGECFEHDPHWSETFANMIRLTRPGGIVAFTCASRGRPEHGTIRSDVRDSPGTQDRGLDYYKNLVAEDFDFDVLDLQFASWRFWSMPTTFDLYFMGVRSGAVSVARLPRDSAIAEIESLISVPHRVIRWPLRLARLVVTSDALYQRVILPYWNTLLRLSQRRSAD